MIDIITDCVDKRIDKHERCKIEKLHFNNKVVEMDYNIDSAEHQNCETVANEIVQSNGKGNLESSKLKIIMQSVL